MTGAEIAATAQRLGVSVTMVDTRPIPESGRVRAPRVQAMDFMDWLSEHGLRDIHADPESNVWIGPARYTVPKLRAALLTGGTHGLLRLVRTHPPARGIHGRSLCRWYAACAADAFRTKEEDEALRAVRAVLTLLGIDLGSAPVRREEA